MKKLIISVVIGIVCLTGCSANRINSSNAVSSNDPNWVAKSFGGTTTVILPPGRKLEEITWKGDDDLWILSRPMRDGEVAEEHIFEQHSNFGILDGRVIIKESED